MATGSYLGGVCCVTDAAISKSFVKKTGSANLRLFCMLSNKFGWFLSNHAAILR